MFFISPHPNYCKFKFNISFSEMRNLNREIEIANIVASFENETSIQLVKEKVNIYDSLLYS